MRHVCREPVTRTFLRPKDASATFTSPDTQTANGVARDRGVVLVRQPMRQQYTVALDGALSGNDTELMSTYIKQAWVLTNTGRWLVSVTEGSQSHLSTHRSEVNWQERRQQEIHMNTNTGKIRLAFSANKEPRKYRVRLLYL